MEDNFNNEEFTKMLKKMSEIVSDKQKQINDAINNSMSKIQIPKIDLPKMDLLKVDLPKINVPKFDVPTTNTEYISKGLQNVVSSLNIPSMSEKILTAFKNIFTDEFREFLKQADINLKENLILNLEILGDLEWCYLEIEGLEDSDIFDLDFPSQLKEYLETHQQASIKDIDEYIAKRFKKETIEDITNRTIMNLDTNDTEKLNQAMIDYRAKRYLDCANLLASLIDAQSIKQELFDMKNNRYVGNIINVSQGWKAFFIVFHNSLSKYFENENFSGDSKKEKRENKFNEFIQKIKPNLNEYQITLPILHLAYCLLKFFDDSDWKNYPQKPEVINRHWLMHGMYDMDDITKSDCIKLLLMLNQLANIYAKLRNGEL